MVYIGGLAVDSWLIDERHISHMPGEYRSSNDQHINRCTSLYVNQDTYKIVHDPKVLPQRVRPSGGS